jgi:hypothetical protein
MKTHSLINPNIATCSLLAKSVITRFNRGCPWVRNYDIIDKGKHGANEVIGANYIVTTPFLSHY